MVRLINDDKIPARQGNLSASLLSPSRVGRRAKYVVLQSPRIVAWMFSLQPFNGFLSILREDFIEFALEFELPLRNKPGRRHDEYTISHPPRLQLFDNETCLNGLTQADLISKNEAMRIGRAHAMDNSDLVGLDLDPRI
jgi:hypothetical protein